MRRIVSLVSRSFIVPLITYEVERPTPIRQLERSRARPRSAYLQVEGAAEECDVESFIAL
jgi:hypothetical protein